MALVMVVAMVWEMIGEMALVMVMEKFKERKEG